MSFTMEASLMESFREWDQSGSLASMKNWEMTTGFLRSAFGNSFLSVCSIPQLPTENKFLLRSHSLLIYVLILHLAFQFCIFLPRMTIELLTTPLIAFFPSQILLESILLSYPYHPPSVPYLIFRSSRIKQVCSKYHSERKFTTQCAWKPASSEVSDCEQANLPSGELSWRKKPFYQWPNKAKSNIGLPRATLMMLPSSRSNRIIPGSKMTHYTKQTSITC